MISKTNMIKVGVICAILLLSSCTERGEPTQSDRNEPAKSEVGKIIEKATALQTPSAEQQEESDQAAELLE